ncbi:DNA ligase-like domain-containing protein [Streptomyces hawaiiensis]|uniref:hypothetical protein n=1 Tax=Streptomyces hawaiiensis TaxID=67305 RepID=UPI00365561C0
MTWSVSEPMLTVAVDSPALPAGWAAEPKWGGYRARLAVHAGGRVLLRSRRGERTWRLCSSGSRAGSPFSGAAR